MMDVPFTEFESRFVTLMEKYTFTENGDVAISEKGLGSTLLAVFDKSMRGANEDEMRRMVTKIFHEGTCDDKINMCCLAFHARDPRCGKGEKSLGISLFLALPHVLRNALAVCLPQHGSWKDVRTLMIREEGDLFDVLVNLYGTTLMKDLHSEMTLVSPQLSLCAKYALRERVDAEKRVLKRVFREFKDIAGDEQPFKVYRQKMSSLREKLCVTETFMSSNRWEDIVPKRVPAECVRCNKKAFLNETKKGETRSETANRHECRHNFLEASSQKEMKAAVLDLPSLVKEATFTISDSARIIIDSQAAAHIEYVKDNIGGNLGSIIPVVDTSGSMSGSPMHVAIGLGLFTAYTAHPAFANRLITFSETPTWIKVDPSDGWTSNVNTVLRAPWGMNTNLASVIDMIMTCLRSASPRLQPEEVPRIVIFSDMQFDHCGAALWQTQCDHIKDNFRNLGLQLVDKEYNLHITFWNLRANTQSYPTTSDTLGVSMLSGYSTNLLKAVLRGDLSKTPLDVLLEILNDEKFNDVRSIASMIIKDKFVE